MSERCPHCHEGSMRSWDELSDDEKAVVERLPQSADYNAKDRFAMHRWCVRCWYESTGSETAA